MHRRLLSGTVALAAVLLSLALSGHVATPAFAQSRVAVENPPFGDGGSDSTTVTIGNSASDTTAWHDLLFEKFPNATFAGFPLIKIVCNTNAATGDSIGLVTQYSNDKSVIFAKTKTYFIGASPQSLIALTADTHANEPAFGFRYIRWIVSDEDVSRTAAFTSLTAQTVFLHGN